MISKAIRILGASTALFFCSSLTIQAQAGTAAVSSGGPIAATAKTATGDGIAHLPKVDGSTTFTVTAINKGDSGKVTVKAETGQQYPVPVDLTVCQTGPSGLCLAKPAGTLILLIAHNASLTFKVIVEGTNNLPRMTIDEAFLNFYNQQGTKVGGASVALSDGTRLLSSPKLAGIYNISINPPAHSSYNLSGVGLLIATTDQDGYVLTQSGIVIHQSQLNFQGVTFQTDGLLYPFPNTSQIGSGHVAFFSLTAVSVLDHWFTSQYQLTGGRVPGFEYGTAFASYQQSLSQRGSSLTRVKGAWKIRAVEGGPVLGKITFDAKGTITSATFRECNRSPGDYTPLDGTITTIDTRFNAYKFQFKNSDILTDDPLCDDLASAGGVAATFDTAAPNDTLRILFNGQSNAYSWILTRR